MNYPSVSLYTPGHCIFTDSLIAYGIVSSIIKELPDCAKDIMITFTGSEYVVEINGLSLEDVVECIILSVMNFRDDIISELVDTCRVIQRQSRIKLENLLDTLMNKDLIRKSLSTYAERGHRIKYGEGRRAKTKKAQHLDTMWLALMPPAGKFRLGLFNAKSIPYLACTTCRALASVGLYYIGMMGFRRGEAAKARRDKPTAGESIEIVPVFNGSIRGELILDYMDILSRDFENIRFRIEDVLDKLGIDLISKLAIVQLAIVGGGNELVKKLYYSEASWHLISIKLTEGATRLEGYDSIHIDPLIKGLYLIINEGVLSDFYALIDESIRRLMEKKAKRRLELSRQINVDVDTIDYLVRFLEERSEDMLYRAVRTAYKDENLGNKLSRQLAEGLAKILGA